MKSSETDISGGYFVLVTNVPGFWKKSSNVTFADDFLIFEGEHKASLKKWSEKASEGTKKGRNKALNIKGEYLFEYKPFYNSFKRSGEFKSLVVEINK